eukprot:346616-Rhodomonas_salina.1
MAISKGSNHLDQSEQPPPVAANTPKHTEPCHPPLVNTSMPAHKRGCHPQSPAHSNICHDNTLNVPYCPLRLPASRDPHSHPHFLSSSSSSSSEVHLRPIPHPLAIVVIIHRLHHPSPLSSSSRTGILERAGDALVKEEVLSVQLDLPDVR